MLRSGTALLKLHAVSAKAQTSNEKKFEHKQNVNKVKNNTKNKDQHPKVGRK